MVFHKKIDIPLGCWQCKHIWVSFLVISLVGLLPIPFGDWRVIIVRLICPNLVGIYFFDNDAIFHSPCYLVVIG